MCDELITEKDEIVSRYATELRQNITMHNSRVLNSDTPQEAEHIGASLGSSMNTEMTRIHKVNNDQLTARNVSLHPN